MDWMIAQLRRREQEDASAAMGLLKQLVPKLSRLAVLWNPANPGNAYCVEEIKAAATAMGMPAP